MYIVIILPAAITTASDCKILLLYLFTNGKIALLFNASRKNLRGSTH
jgi:hypothetical protein